jgi:2-hydroxy-3-keto-5-methylthiopentenyl-1-phosphate phosphatase
MDSKYFVAIRPRLNDFHSVHKEGCPFLMENDKKIYLGFFNSDIDAEKEGRKHFNKSKSCPFCSKEKKVTVELSETDDVLYSIMNWMEPEEQASYESLVCCVN